VGLYASSDEVPKHVIPVPQAGGDTGNVETQGVLGQSGWFVVATRPAGYHSSPHVHDAEKFNYALKGERWFSINDEAFLMKPGEFSRVLPNAVHWQWNSSDEPCTFIEEQIPPVGRPTRRAHLAAESEIFSDEVAAPAFYVDPEVYNVAAIESKVD